MRNPSRSSAGFSLIELMVGALIGLIATVIIFQMFAVAEGQKRATTGASDSLQAGTQAMFQLERDAALAGYGMSRHLYGCKINGWYDNGTPGGQLIELRMVPLFIDDNVGGNQSDELTVFSASTDRLSVPSGLLSTQTAPQDKYALLNTYGFAPGDLTVAINYKTTDPAAKDCTLAQVSSVVEDDVFHLPGTYVKGGLTKPIQFNRAGGLPPPKNVLYEKFVAPAKGGLLFNIGSLPRVLTYRVENGSLVNGNRFLPTGTPIVVAENVVQFQVHYAIDGGNPYPTSLTPKSDGIFNALAATEVAAATGNLANDATDHWAHKLPAFPVSGSFDPEQWAKILAIRMAIVTRGEYEKKPGAATCDASTANPKWKAAGDIELDVSAVPDWQCYRYKVQEMTVPLRNLTWSPAELGIQPKKPGTP